MKTTTLSIISFLGTLVLVLTSIQLNGQDIITKTDGSVIEASVMQINPKNIKFQFYGQSNAETITLLKSEIANIEYENGQKVTYNTVNPSSRKSSSSSSAKLNAIGVNPIMLLTDLNTRIATLEYERYLEDMFSIGGRLIHYSREEDLYEEQASGIGIFFRKYFNNDQGLKGFYVGSSLDILGVKWTDSWYNGNFDLQTEEGSGMAVVVMSQLGYKINIGDTFFVEPMLSVGFYNSSTESDLDSYDEFGFIYTPALSFGMKF